MVINPRRIVADAITHNYSPTSNSVRTFSATDDKRGTNQSNVRSEEDKMSALKSYRKAKWL